MNHCNICEEKYDKLCTTTKIRADILQEAVSAIFKSGLKPRYTGTIFCPEIVFHVLHPFDHILPEPEEWKLPADMTQEQKRLFCKYVEARLALIQSNDIRCKAYEQLDDAVQKLDVIQINMYRGRNPKI